MTVRLGFRYLDLREGNVISYNKYSKVEDFAHDVKLTCPYLRCLILKSSLVIVEFTTP